MNTRESMKMRIAVLPGKGYTVEAECEVIWRWLLRCIGLRFIERKTVWKPLRRVLDNAMPEFSPYGDGYTLAFDTPEEARQTLERRVV